MNREKLHPLVRALLWLLASLVTAIVAYLVLEEVYGSQDVGNRPSESHRELQSSDVSLLPSVCD